MIQLYPLPDNALTPGTRIQASKPYYGMLDTPLVHTGEYGTVMSVNRGSILAVISYGVLYDNGYQCNVSPSSITSDIVKPDIPLFLRYGNQGKQSTLEPTPVPVPGMLYAGMVSIGDCITSMYQGFTGVGYYPIGDSERTLSTLPRMPIRTYKRYLLRLEYSIGLLALLGILTVKLDLPRELLYPLLLVLLPLTALRIRGYVQNGY